MNHHFATPRCNSRRRRGMVTVIVLVLFAVTFTLAAVWTKRMLAERRTQIRAEERVQTEWLAEAGVRRAAARLLIDSDYNGEEWLITAAEINRPHPARVQITVEATDAPDKFRLTARARYPREQHRIQTTKSVAFTPPSTETQP
jgi:type II secretory pathway component PulK